MAQDLYTARVKSPAPGAPLIFAFHGTGGDENQFFGLAEKLAPGAGVIAPRGNVSEAGAARFFRRSGEGVYDMADLAQRRDQMAAFVNAHARQHPTSPLYGFGYSNGANILAAVAMAVPLLFERIALLHPLIPWVPDPVPDLAGKSVLITAGQNDPICPWPMSEALIGWFSDQSATVDTVVHPGGHEIRPEEGDALMRWAG